MSVNPMTIPQDTSVESEYQDGYIHNEAELNDVSPYESGRNVLYDILEKRPEAEHGKMVRFSVFWKDHRYDINWCDLPDNARPIRFRDGNFSKDMSTGEERFWWSAVRFGYQFNDSTGKNIKELKELT
jgi:hypothetical protein